MQPASLMQRARPRRNLVKIKCMAFLSQTPYPPTRDRVVLLRGKGARFNKFSIHNMSFVITRYIYLVKSESLKL